MKKNALLFVALLSTGSAHAGEGRGDYIYADKIVKRFKITKVSPYKDYYLSSMRYQMLRFRLNGSDNVFCAIGYQSENCSREAAIFWDKGQTLTRWQPEGYDFSDYKIKVETIADSPYISYDYIVPKKDIGMWDVAAYAKEDVDPMRADCERNGEVIIVKAFPASEACKSDLESFDCLDPLSKMRP